VKLLGLTKPSVTEISMLKSSPPDAESVRAELTHLKDSSEFVRCSTLYTFLRFIVDETLVGRGDTLKELVVGDALYHGRNGYDPRIDSTVRVEARRLRRKLAGYYCGDGERNPVRINLPVGTYRPSFSWNYSQDQDGGIVVKGERLANRIGLAIMPFTPLATDDELDSFADGITDELIFALEQHSTLRLAPRMMVFQYRNRAYTVPDAARTLGVVAMLHGTLRRDGARRRITVELTDPQGFITWSDRIDGFAGDPIQAQEQIAQEIVTRMPSWVMGDRPTTSLSQKAKRYAQDVFRCEP